MAEEGTGMEFDQAPDSILVLRLKALGDIALSVPIVNSLRRTFPDARIDYLCFAGYGEALRGNSDIDNVIEFRKGFLSQVKLMLSLRKSGYGLALDLISSPRSAVITLFTGAPLRIGMDVGRHNFCYHRVLPREIKRGGRKIKMYTMDANREIAAMLALEPDRWKRQKDRHRTGFSPAKEEESWAEEYLAGVASVSRGLAGIVPAAKYQAKSYPAERFVQFIEMLISRSSYTPILIWGPGEETVADYIAERTGAVKPPLIGIARLGALINRLDCLVGVDSGPKHLAVMQGVPTLTIFGPTDPEAWDPCSDIHRVVMRELDCGPCGRTECSTVECMIGISPAGLYDEFEKLMEYVREGGKVG